jgi:microcystin-dependent protein
MAEPFLGEIRIVSFNFVPRGWAPCDGRLLPINQNQALFSLLGTTYGGDGRTNFALPDYRGRVPVGFGTGPGLTDIAQGQKGGAETVALTAANLAHGHPIPASSGVPTTNRPTGAYQAAGNSFSATSNTTMAATESAGAASPTAHENRPPYLAVNYAIAVQGIFPSQN